MMEHPKHADLPKFMVVTHDKAKGITHFHYESTQEEADARRSKILTDLHMRFEVLIYRRSDETR